MFLTGLSLLSSGNRGDFAALTMGFIYPPVLFNTAAGAVNNTIIDCFLMLLIRATAMDSILFYMKFANDDGVKRKLKPDPFYGILLDK